MLIYIQKSLIFPSTLNPIYFRSFIMATKWLGVPPHKLFPHNVIGGASHMGKKFEALAIKDKSNISLSSP